MSELVDALKTDEARTAQRQSYFAKWDGEKFVYGLAASNLRNYERMAAELKGIPDGSARSEQLKQQMADLWKGFDEAQMFWAGKMTA